MVWRSMSGVLIPALLYTSIIFPACEFLSMGSAEEGPEEPSGNGTDGGETNGTGTGPVGGGTNGTGGNGTTTGGNGTAGNGTTCGSAKDTLTGTNGTCESKDDQFDSEATCSASTCTEEECCPAPTTVGTIKVEFYIGSDFEIEGKNGTTAKDVEDHYKTLEDDVNKILKEVGYKTSFYGVKMLSEENITLPEEIMNRATGEKEKHNPTDSVSNAFAFQEAMEAAHNYDFGYLNADVSRILLVSKLEGGQLAHEEICLCNPGRRYACVGVLSPASDAFDFADALAHALGYGETEPPFDAETLKWTEEAKEMIEKNDLSCLESSSSFRIAGGGSALVFIIVGVAVGVLLLVALTCFVKRNNTNKKPKSKPKPAVQKSRSRRPAE